MHEEFKARLDVVRAPKVTSPVETASAVGGSLNQRGSTKSSYFGRAKGVFNLQGRAKGDNAELERNNKVFRLTLDRGPQTLNKTHNETS